MGFLLERVYQLNVRGVHLLSALCLADQLRVILWPWA